MRKEDFLTKVSSAQVSDRAEIIMVDCRVELVYSHYLPRTIKFILSLLIRKEYSLQALA